VLRWRYQSELGAIRPANAAALKAGPHHGLEVRGRPRDRRPFSPPLDAVAVDTEEIDRVSVASVAHGAVWFPAQRDRFVVHIQHGLGSGT
jgi:hypothetical protein